MRGEEPSEASEEEEETGAKRGQVAMGGGVGGKARAQRERGAAIRAWGSQSDTEPEHDEQSAHNDDDDDDA